MGATMRLERAVSDMLSTGVLYVLDSEGCPVEVPLEIYCEEYPDAQPYASYAEALAASERRRNAS